MNLRHPIDDGSSHEGLAAPAKARRRLFRFGLRTVFVVALIASIGMAVVGRKFYAMRQEAAAVEALLAAPAGISFEYQRDEDGWIHHDDTPPPDPYGLNEYLGEHFFAEAIAVRLASNEKTTAEHVALLPRLTHLEDVSLNGETFGDETLEPLGRCEELRELTLSYTRVTGDGLARLANRDRIETFFLSGEADLPAVDDPLARVDRLTNLKTCYVSNVFLTKTHTEAIGRLEKLETLELLGLSGMDPGALEPLAKLDSLKTLVFGNPYHVPLGDDDLAAIVQMDRLDYLAFDGERVTDEGVRNLAKLRRLRRLSATMPGVTDAGIASLADVATLEELYLARSPITDAALDDLDRLPSLKLLYVGPSVSPERAARFAKAAPGREVRRFFDAGLGDSEIYRYEEPAEESRPRGRSERAIPFLP